MNFLSTFLETLENDTVIVNLKEETIIWKSNFNPKLRNDILYWFNERRRLNINQN